MFVFFYFYGAATQKNRMAATTTHQKNRMAAHPTATQENRMAATHKNRMAPHHPREPHGSPQATSASSVTMFLGWVCVRQRHNKTREIPLQNFCNVKNSGMGFLLSSPLRHYRLISGANIFIHHYLRQASAMTFSLRAMKSESALPLSRPLERRARSITCLRMSLPAAYSSTTA